LVSHAWLQAQSRERILEDGTAGSALIEKILNSDFRPDDPASLTTLLSSFTPSEEAVISEILGREVPADAKLVAEDCWHEMEKRSLIRQRQAIESRLRIPGITMEAMAQLNDRVMEIQRQLLALPAPRPPKL
jgi:hypothetical protein